MIWIGDRRELLGRDFDRFSVECWKPIKTKLAALRKYPNENRKAGGRKRRKGIFPDVEPVHDLAVHLEQMRVCRRQKTGDPGSGGDDDLPGEIGSAAGLDRHSGIPAAVDRDNNLIRLNDCTMLACEMQLGLDTKFRP